MSFSNGKTLKEDLLEAKTKKSSYTYFTVALDYQYGFQTKANPRLALKYYKKAAKIDGFGISSLAKFYLTDTKYKSVKKAIKTHEAAVKSGWYLSLFDLGVLFYEGEHIKRDGDKAFKYFKECEKQSDYAPLFSYIGYCYLTGTGTPINDELALSYFNKSKDEPLSLRGLGVCYLYGYGVDVDKDKGYKYIKKAVDKGCKKAYKNYADCLYHGYGCKKDRNKAYIYLTMCSEKDFEDSPYALYLLGECHYFGYDYEKAYECHSTAFARGVKRSALRLGIMTYEGKACEKNYQQAYKYFKIAEELTYVLSYYYLGRMYRFAQAVPQDYKKAFEYFSKAHECDETLALDELTEAYCFGQGTEIDYHKAFELAQKSKSSYGLFVLGKLSFFGQGTEKNYNLAFKYFEESANKGYQNSYYFLGLLYEYGEGVSKDIDKAISYYLQGANGSKIEIGNKQRCLEKLASIYSNESLNRINYNLAYRYASEAMNLSSVKAKRILSLLYLKGEGVNSDSKKAYQLIKEATLEGDFEAFLYFAILHQYNIYKNPKELFEVFEKYKSHYKCEVINNNYVYTTNMKKSFAFIFTQKYKYFGGRNKDLPEGHGLAIYDNGYYFGNFKNGFRDDNKGTYIWNNGEKYTGTFIKGYRTGKGDLYWPSGGHYKGDFVDGVRQGKGVYWYANGNTYEGDFVNNERSGKGTLWLNNGDYYEGEFLNDKRHGQGRYIFKDGDEIVGEFRNDEKFDTKFIDNHPSSSSDYDDSPSNSYDNNDDDNYDYDYDDSDDSYNSGYTTLVDEYGNETEINNITGRDSDGNLWESDGYFSDTYHMVDEDDD